MPYTSYLGEYDDIQVSSEARTLANVGFWGKSKLLGATIFNGLASSVSKFWNSWIFSPSKWSKKSNGFASGAVATVVDTNDLYIATDHAWKRPSFSNTLYNAYYLTDKEIVEKGQADFFEFFKKELFKRAEQHPRVKEMFYLMMDGKNWPHFVFRPRCLSHGRDGRCTRWQTEEEAFAEWKAKPYQVDYDKRGKKQGIDCFKRSKLYKDLRMCWEQPWNDYARKEINHDMPTMQQIMAKMENDFFKNNPRYDINKGFSHYVCGDSNGKPLGTTFKEYKYLYTKENTRTKEFLNPSCQLVRPSIKGSLFTKEKTDDTRFNIFYDNKEKFNKSEISLLGSLFYSINKFNTQLTNTMISLSFSNLLDFKWFKEIVIEMTNKFRDTLFFPLVLLFIPISMLILFLKQKSFKDIGIIIIIFVIGISILFNPNLLLKATDEVPKAIDNIAAELILTNDSNNPLCSTNGKDKNSGIRSIQCSIWENNIFKPYIYGQWGILNYQDLDNKNFNNKNKNLVGKPIVNFGNDVKIENWSLWQLSKIKSGTITTENLKELEGTTRKDLYKLVDLQAGPENSKNSDTKYLNNWSGISHNREMIQFIAMIVSALMLIIVGGISFLKIEITISMILKILYFPIMLIMALLPEKNVKFKQYFIELFNMFVKRFVIVISLVFVLIILKLMSDLSTDYYLSSIFLISLMLGMLIYYKEFLNLLTNPTENLAKQAIDNIPFKKQIEREFNIKKVEYKAKLSGAIGGGLVGGTESFKNSFRKERIVRKDGKSHFKAGITEGIKDTSQKELRKLQHSLKKDGNMPFLNDMNRIKQKIDNTLIKKDSDYSKELNNVLNNLKQRSLEKQQEMLNHEYGSKSFNKTLEEKKDVDRVISRITLNIDSNGNYKRDKNEIIKKEIQKTVSNNKVKLSNGELIEDKIDDKIDSLINVVKEETTRENKPTKKNKQLPKLDDLIDIPNKEKTQINKDPFKNIKTDGSKELLKQIKEFEKGLSSNNIFEVEQITDSKDLIIDKYKDLENSKGDFDDNEKE